MNLKFSHFDHDSLYCKVGFGKTPYKGLNTIAFEKEEATIYPENYHFRLEKTEAGRANLLKAGDILRIDSNGIARKFISSYEDDCCLFITPRCNSNCIMCPSSSNSRKFGVSYSLADILEAVKYIPRKIHHITITGGEPFLLRDGMFVLLRNLKNTFNTTECLLLTNGRAFGNKEYAKQFLETAPYYTQVAIPIHGSTAKKHDRITQTPGSFEQTVTGIKRLSGSFIRIEVRIVVTRLNCNDIVDIARFIINHLKGVSIVNIVAPEMLGNAAINAANVWIPYDEAFKSTKKAVDILVAGGVDVSYYCFPLCMVEAPYRQLCEKSISFEKVRFAPQCNECRMKEECGGIFAGTYRYLEKAVTPL